MNVESKVDGKRETFDINSIHAEPYLKRNFEMLNVGKLVHFLKFVKFVNLPSVVVDVRSCWGNDKDLPGTRASY